MTAIGSRNREPHVVSGPDEPQAVRRQGMGPVRDHATGAGRTEEPPALGHMETRAVQKDPGPDEQGLGPGASRYGQVRGHPEQGVRDAAAGPSRARPGGCVTVAQPRRGGAADRAWPVAPPRPPSRRGGPGCRWRRRRARSCAPSTSQAGPFVPGSMERWARRASSLSGMKSPVKTTTSTATVRSAPSGPRTSTPSTRSRPVTPVTAVRVQTGTWRPTRVCEVEGAECLRVREVGHERHRLDAGLAQGQHAPSTRRARPPQ